MTLPRTQPAAVPLAAMRGVWKLFASVTVLRGVDFEIRPGETHALLGGNGSGKSTLVKILSGAYRPTAGTVEIGGAPQALGGPADAHALGIYMVPQEPHVFPNLSILENLLIGLDGDLSALARRAGALADEIGLKADFSAPGGELSIANQQLVEIIRGLLRDARVLILDEPTSSLTRREVESLAAQMRKLTAQGIGILFISHRLDEVLTFSDRVSVLRDGGFVLSAPASELTSEALVAAMLPADYAPAAEAARGAAPAADAAPVLEVRGLSGLAFQDVSFSVRPGEVVGVAGVVGSGRTELAEAIFGVDPEATGEVVIAGTPVSGRSPRLCQELGLSYVPEDRHAHGVFLSLPSAHTISASLMTLRRSGFMSAARERALAQDFVGRLRIKLASPLQIAGTLSGGNQQKIVLAKTLAPDPRAIILDEPTRGIDASARQDVYRIIRELTADGVGVVVISSEVSEIAEVSDRILIMKRGRLLALPPGRRSVAEISAAAFEPAGGASA